PERHDRREERSLKERGVHGGVPQRILAVELSVGLAARGLESVLLDDPRLAIGGEGVGHTAARQTGVVRSRDALLGERAADHQPRADAAADEEYSQDDGANRGCPTHTCPFLSD